MYVKDCAGSSPGSLLVRIYDVVISSAVILIFAWMPLLMLNLPRKTYVSAYSFVRVSQVMEVMDGE